MDGINGKTWGWGDIPGVFGGGVTPATTENRKKPQHLSDTVCVPGTGNAHRTQM